MKYLTSKELLFELRDVIHVVDYKSMKQLLNKECVERFYNTDKLSPINKLHVLSREIKNKLDFKHDVLLKFYDHEYDHHYYVIIARCGDFYRW